MLFELTEPHLQGNAWRCSFNRYISMKYFIFGTSLFDTTFAHSCGKQWLLTPIACARTDVEVDGVALLKVITCGVWEHVDKITRWLICITCASVSIYIALNSTILVVYNWDGFKGWLLKTEYIRFAYIIFFVWMRKLRRCIGIGYSVVSISMSIQPNHVLLRKIL